MACIDVLVQKSIQYNVCIMLILYILEYLVMFLVKHCKYNLHIFCITAVVLATAFRRLLSRHWKSLFIQMATGYKEVISVQSLTGWSEVISIRSLISWLLFIIIFTVLSLPALFLRLFTTRWGWVFYIIEHLISLYSA